MPLFMVQHTHAPDVCPAPDPKVAPQLLQILAAAPEAGVRILAEAVVDGEHELNLIVEAADANTVERFMGPLGRMGRVTVRPASHCEKVVERGRC